MEIKLYLTMEVDDDFSVEDELELIECIEQSVQHYGEVTDSEIK